MSGIFISYRRQDTAYIAGRLHDRLAAHFGVERIFRDIDTMKPGVDFGEHIEDAVGSCDALLVVIGDDWLESRDAQGQRRIDAPRDWVRQEIEVALARPDVLVIPVLVEDARMPDEGELPPSIRRLARRNAMELTDRRWDYEVQKLIEALEEVVDGAAGAARTPPREEAPPVAPVPTPWGPHRAGGPGSGPPPPGDQHLAPPAPASGGRHVPTWLKVAVPVLALLVVVAGAVLVANLGSGDDGGPPATEAVLTSTTRGGRVTTTARGRTTTTAGTRVVNGPFTGRSGAVTLTVQKLEAGARQVRVHLEVVNGTRDGLRLPANGFSAVDSTGHSYPVDPFSRDWRDDIPPGARVAGILDLTEPLRAGAATMRVGWSTVFGSLQVRSIFVDRVVLT